MEPLDHDTSYKEIYGHPFMVEELARWLIPALEGGRELFEALDFATLTRLPEQSVSGGRRRSNDMVWRVMFRGREGAHPEGWLHLVLMLEFQSEVDFLMALRCRHYVDGFYLENWRGTRFGAADRLPPVLMFVVYNGARRWTAARRVVDLVTPDTAVAAEAMDLSWPGPLFAGDGYRMVDSGRVVADDWKENNAAVLLAGLEHPSVDTAGELAVRLYRHLEAEELRPLRELLLNWARRVVERRLGWDIGVDDMAEVDRLHESDELEAYFEKRRLAFVNAYREEGRREGREEGREEGLKEGREEARKEGRAEARARARALLQRQAAKRFGTRTAASLTAFLEGVDDAERLAEAADWIVDCDTAADLIARLEAAGQSAIDTM